MQHLEVSCAVRRLFKSLGFKWLINKILYPRSQRQSVITVKSSNALSRMLVVRVSVYLKSVLM